jgi:hypothetical protein
MATLLTGNLAMIKSAAESSFFDSCSIHTPTTTLTNLGTQSKSFSTSSNIRCGFNPNDSDKTFQKQSASGNQQFSTFNHDGILRLSLDQAITPQCEITVRGIRYRIDGINTGISCKILKLKKVDSNG